jgi:8-oxo-dGTP diphosphatase
MVGEAHGGEDVIIPHTEYGFEPLHALYNRSCISYFLTAIGKNRLKIPDTFCYLSVRELRYHPSFQHKGHPVFTNINMEKDLSIIPDMNRSENRTIREMNRTDIGEVPSSSSLPGVSSPWGRTVMKKKTNPKIVTAAVIERDGHILIAKRKQGKQHVGNWEFPGGTLEEGETPEQCLKRELQEELAITAEVGGLICISEYSYTPDWTIRLLAYRTTVISGIFNLNDHEEIRWVKPTDLANYDFPEADRPIVEKLIKEDRQ